MESLPSLHHSLNHHSLRLSLNNNNRHSTPFSFLSFPPLPKKIHALHKPTNPLLTHVLKTLNPLSVTPLLKTTCIAAALFLMRLHLNSPTVALAANAPISPPHAAGAAAAEAADSTPENPYNEENGSEIDALRSLVESKIRERKIDEAIGIVDRLTEMEPEELDWPLLKAHLCARSGDHAAARNLFEEVLKRDPYHVVALHGLLMAISELKEPTKDLLIRLEEAVKFFESEKRDSEMRDLKLLIAQVKVLKGELSGALKVYEELAEEEPEDFRPYLCQGVVYTMMRKKDEAERQFERFRELVPEDHDYKEYFEDNANSFLEKLEESEGMAAKR